jgi:CRISPR-associated protein Csy2
MSQFILINRIKVQNANAIAGFTWGFPAITHFLGFTHNLARKLAESGSFKDIFLTGCAVISHEHHVHTYGSYNEHEFTQSRNPAYKHDEESKYKVGTPPIIEEGKMNMTVSLLIGYEGNVGNRQENLIKWLTKACLLQRLAGGSILNIKSIETYKPEKDNVIKIKRKLLPGFVLRDRSNFLEDHYQAIQKKNSYVELLDAWLDFAALKQKARPKSDLINKHILKLNKTEPDNSQYIQLTDVWQKHLQNPYQEDLIPDELIHYFNDLENNDVNEKLLTQWKDYCVPNQETQADWEYIAKPETGYLVPIMTGYKAVSKTYDKTEVANIRAKSMGMDKVSYL